MAMFHSICDCFLRNSIELDCFGVIHDQHLLRTVESTGDVEKRLCVQSKLPKRRHQAVSFQIDRRKATRQHPRLQSSLTYQLRDCFCFFPKVGILLELFRENGGGVLKPDQMLAKAIVEV